MGAMTMLPLSLTELTISYGRAKIFDELTHAFPTGCHVIAGPNGAGKSTLLGAVCGVIPYRGRISIAGYDLKRNFVDARRNLAFVPDAATFYPFVTGEEYARLVAHAHGQGEAVGGARFTHLVHRLNVEPYLGTTFGEASLGTRKKFMHLAALLIERPLLVLDEPFNGLDRMTADALVELIHDAARAGTVLMTCHQSAFVEATGATLWHIGQAPHNLLRPEAPARAVA
ncbi:ABC transporter ATP-binding protein [Xanthomonas fragariae]|uniref:ATP-binding cassette domain-containing protein n=1 Tax=Xanthomonas fragariae TaxID=48664 RepID=UPI0022AA4A1C|nr:ABC transporter ATP-binding protein [Xanthomonas fragariae]WAT14826.1 ABC transporter ATP-binding protein [Xanthomonas fragariae]